MTAKKEDGGAERRWASLSRTSAGRDGTIRAHNQAKVSTMRVPESPSTHAVSAAALVATPAGPVRSTSSSRWTGT